MIQQAAPDGAPYLLLSASEDETLRAGAALAQALLPLLAARSRALVFALAGPLGAGKTTLVRGLLAQLGVAGPVRSPSFALLENYDTPRAHAIHVDLYRLNNPEEVELLGLRDFDLPGWLWLIEWPERAGNALGAPDLWLRFSIDEAHHGIALTPGSADGRVLLRQLRMAVGDPAAEHG